MNDDGGSRMMKYSVAAILLGLYASISAWIVAGEGEEYRRALALKLASAPEKTPAPTPAARPDPVDPPEKSIARAPEPSPPPAPTKEPKPSVDRSSTPEPEHKPKSRTPVPTPPTPKAPAPPPIDPFWDEPDQKKVWDLDRLTADEERQLGYALHQMILHVNSPIEDGPLPKRMEDAAKPYLKTVNRKDLKYTFTVLDSPRMNAFSHPGGYIYVCKGLFDWISEDEDYALGFILAHEIAHVDLMHAITCLRDPDVKAKIKLGTVLLFYALMIPGGYLDKQDLEADRWAAERMLKAGRSRYETLAFLRRLEDYAKSNGFENKRKNPRDKPEVPPLDNHIRAHPIPRERLEELKAFIDRLLKP